MSIQDLTNSRLGVALALGIGRGISPRHGYSLANRLARWIATSKKIKMVQAVRANQWVVSGGSLSLQELDAVTRDTFSHTGRCLYDLYHTLGHPDGILQKVVFSPEFEALKTRVLDNRQGSVFVCPHMSNFDLVGRALGLSGMNFLVLSYPEPPGGYRWQNEMRRRVGLEMLPMSVSALRKAVERLQAGGAVLTGVDRPLNDANYRPHFFGRPAYLPAGHVRLALKTNSPVYVVASMMRPDGMYVLEASGPITMKPLPDREAEMVRNAEAILEQVETYIWRAPAQWSMFYPVWPEALTEIPV